MVVSRVLTRSNLERKSDHQRNMKGEEQNREEGEMAQKKLGAGRNRGGK